jgi:hypothetical protein
MNKKHMVRLTQQERDELATVLKKFKGTSHQCLPPLSESLCMTPTVGVPGGW